MPHPVPCPTCGVEAWKLEAEIERLRGLVASQSFAVDEICKSAGVKAADKIERLRADLKSEREAHQVCVQMRNDAETENKRLRGEIERLRAAMQEIIDADDPIMREASAEIERLKAALKPFALKADGFSLSHALGHITREHLLDARRALEGK